MADVKISALPAATTPLTGGEVLPVVQSGVTTKVAVSNLTAGLAGTASININGTVGATTPTTGAFTSGTFSTTLGVTGTSTLAAVNASGKITVSTTGSSFVGLNGFGSASSPLATAHIKGSGTSGQVTASWLLENSSSGTAGMDLTGAPGSSYWRLLVGAGPGTGTNTLTEAIRINVEASPVGAVTMPAQPAFLAFAADQANVTGDGTTYTVLFATETFDQGSNFASPTFTAPVTGKYRFSVTVRLEGVLVGHTSSVLQFVTSNRNYALSIINPFVIFDASNGLVTLSGTTLADMDAADTCTVTLVVSNSTKTVDIGGSGFFSGELVC